MGKMVDSLNKIAPNTTMRFLATIMYDYGRTAEEFEELPLQQRLMMVKRWLGYSMTQEPGLDTESVISKIKALFEENERIILKYPQGAPDILKQLKYMSNEDKTKYLSEFNKRIIKICLHHALIHGYSLIRLSLKDSLIARQLTMAEVQSKQELEKQNKDLQFWKEIINEFKKDEIVPF